MGKAKPRRAGARDGMKCQELTGWIKAQANQFWLFRIEDHFPKDDESRNIDWMLDFDATHDERADR
ncbi:MAG: hypothetical protein AB8B58_12650 [Roseobacter sp.]